jgi:hypothetical protein
MIGGASGPIHGLAVPFGRGAALEQRDRSADEHHRERDADKEPGQSSEARGGVHGSIEKLRAAVFKRARPLPSAAFGLAFERELAVLTVCLTPRRRAGREVKSRLCFYGSLAFAPKAYDARRHR